MEQTNERAHYQFSKKQINTILAYEFPARFADALLASLSINPESKIADLSREQKEMIYKTLGD